MSSYEDVKAKAATRASGASASKPGAVAVAAAEASRLDARLAEKRTNNPAPIELLNFERDLIADQSQVRLATARAGDESKPMARETEDRKEEQDSIHSDTMMTAAVVPGAYVESVGATAMATPFRRWTTCRARKEKTNSTLALAQASEPRVSLLFSPPGPSMV